MTSDQLLFLALTDLFKCILWISSQVLPAEVGDCYFKQLLMTFFTLLDIPLFTIFRKIGWILESIVLRFSHKTGNLNGVIILMRPLLCQQEIGLKTHLAFTIDLVTQFRKFFVITQISNFNFIVIFMENYSSHYLLPFFLKKTSNQLSVGQFQFMV